MFLVYTTSMSTDTVGDRAVGLDTLSHTNTVAVYEPELVGVHDWAAVIDWPLVSEPVNHESDTVTPDASWTCTKYANAWSLLCPFVTSAAICTCWSTETSATELPDASTTRALDAGALSSGGNAVPTVVVAAKSKSSEAV